jgi:hypothetical protein
MKYFEDIFGGGSPQTMPTQIYIIYDYYFGGE